MSWAPRSQAWVLSELKASANTPEICECRYDCESGSKDAYLSTKKTSVLISWRGGTGFSAVHIHVCAVVIKGIGLCCRVCVCASVCTHMHMCLLGTPIYWLDLLKEMVAATTTRLGFPGVWECTKSDSSWLGRRNPQSPEDHQIQFPWQLGT